MKMYVVKFASAPEGEDVVATFASREDAERFCHAVAFGEYDAEGGKFYPTEGNDLYIEEVEAGADNRPTLYKEEIKMEKNVKVDNYSIIILGTNVVVERDLTEADALDIIYKYIHEDRANKEEQIGYILRNTLTGEETLIDC